MATKVTTEVITLGKFKVSKKLTVALLVFLLEFVRGFGLELPVESYETIQYVAMAYLGGQSFVDAVLAYKGKK